jgi:phytoene dehydrogenase-like protein
VCSYVVSLMRPEVIRELELAKHGLHILPLQSSFAPMENGDHFATYPDHASTRQEIARHSQRDADIYPKFEQLMYGMAYAVKPILSMVPPDLWRPGLRGLHTLSDLGRHVRGLGKDTFHELTKIMTMPVADLLDEWFESDVVKGEIAANGVRDLTWGPKEAGTAYALLYNWALSDPGCFRSAGVVKGGIGALCDALAASARSFGAEIRTGVTVSGIATEEGRAVGVKLPGDEMLRAPVIVSNADPRTTFFELLDPYELDAKLVRHVRNIKYRGSAARVLLALSGLPDFTALRGDERATLLRGPIQIAPTLTSLQRA